MPRAAARSDQPSALYYDMVRVGLATYGLYPAPHLQATVDLRPALSVKARITHIKTINAGDGVSYGHQFVASQPMTIATVSIGYADGIPRVLSNQMEAVLHGQRIRQLGAITMDQTMFDISNLTADGESVKEGDVVTLLGQSADHWLSVERWAEMAQTISWEILCGFKHRLPRIHSAPGPVSHTVRETTSTPVISSRENPTPCAGSENGKTSSVKL
ncbi:MAG: hypothetical protein HC800_07235 [Phormidesmis sp. RL_2_1]|nr:hypothetical protein [Phormidesmis sp. RL_2_1]